MTKTLDGKRIAFLVANEGIEQAELTEPWQAVAGRGRDARAGRARGREVQAFNHLDPADSFPVDRTTATRRADDYDGLVLPGGVANADEIRTDRRRGPVRRRGRRRATSRSA